MAVGAATAALAGAPQAANAAPPADAPSLVKVTFEVVVASIALEGVVR